MKHLGIHILVLQMVFYGLLPTIAQARSDLGVSTAQSRKNLLDRLNRSGLLNRGQLSFTNRKPASVVPVREKAKKEKKTETEEENVIDTLMGLNVLDLLGIKKKKETPPTTVQSLNPFPGINNFDSSRSTNRNSGGKQEKDGADRIVVNDAPPPGVESTPAEKRGLDPDKHKTPPQNELGEGSQTAPVAHPLWKPVCFLIDPATPNANESIKGVVDSWASCQVVAEVYAFTVKDIPRKADEINELAKQVCPLAETFDVDESSIQTHVRWDNVADEMCGSFEEDGKTPTKDVAGCALFVPPRNKFSKDQLDKLNKKLDDAPKNNGHGFGGSGSDGKDAVSILDMEGQSAGVAIHELQHNNGGVNEGEGDPNKPHGDFGIQSVKEDDLARSPSNGVQIVMAEKHDHSELGTTFTEEGCQHLRDSSNPNLNNEHVYIPNKELYYKHIENPAYQYSMMEGKSFFDGPKGIIPPLARKKSRGPDAPLPDPPKAAKAPAQATNEGGKPTGHTEPTEAPAPQPTTTDKLALDNENEFFDTKPERPEEPFFEESTDIPPIETAEGSPPTGPEEGTKGLGYNEEAEAALLADTPKKKKKTAAAAPKDGKSEGVTSIRFNENVEGAALTLTNPATTSSAGGIAPTDKEELGGEIELTEGEESEEEGAERDIASMDEAFFGEGKEEEGLEEQEDTSQFDKDFWNTTKPKEATTWKQRLIQIIKP